MLAKIKKEDTFNLVFLHFALEIDSLDRLENIIACNYKV